METEFNTFKEFYPFYLSQHQNTVCKGLHFFGTTIVISTAVHAIIYIQPQLLPLLPVFGYGPAWVGHFFFEKNKPATFKYPFYSFIADFVMYFDILTGRVKLLR